MLCCVVLCCVVLCCVMEVQVQISETMRCLNPITRETSEIDSKSQSTLWRDFHVYGATGVWALTEEHQNAFNGHDHIGHSYLDKQMTAAINWSGLSNEMFMHAGKATTNHAH